MRDGCDIMKRILLRCMLFLFVVTYASATAYIERWIDEDGCERFGVIDEDNPDDVIDIPASTPEERNELRDFEIEVADHGDGDFTIIDSRNDRRWECDHSVDLQLTGRGVILSIKTERRSC